MINVRKKTSKNKTKNSLQQHHTSQLMDDILCLQAMDDCCSDTKHTISLLLLSMLLKWLKSRTVDFKPSQWRGSSHEPCEPPPHGVDAGLTVSGGHCGDTPSQVFQRNKKKINIMIVTIMTKQSHLGNITHAFSSTTRLTARDNDVGWTIVLIVLTIFGHVARACLRTTRAAVTLGICWTFAIVAVLYSITHTFGCTTHGRWRLRRKSKSKIKIKNTIKIE